MSRSVQESQGVKDFMGLQEDMALSCADAKRQVYAPSRPGQPRKQMCRDKGLQPTFDNWDPHVSSQQLNAEALAAARSNIRLDAVQWHPAVSSPWLYNSNCIDGLPRGNSILPALGHPDWSYPGGRQQFFSSSTSQEKRGSVQTANNYKAYHIMHAGDHGNLTSKCSYLANCVLDSSAGLRVREFPSVGTPLLHEQSSTLQISTESNRAQTSAKLLVGEGPFVRMQPTDSSIKPNSTQLTIFYAGKINVYNDVSSIKAQEIMLMAASSSSLPSNMDLFSAISAQTVTPALSRSLDAPKISCKDPFTCHFDEARNRITIEPPLLSCSTSQTLQAEQNSTKSATQSMCVDDGPAFPQALPQARKASLIRFFKRRKKRVLSKSPYPVEKSFF